MTTKKYVKNYPRPQFVRDHWVDLNGEWRFGFDDAGAGEAAGWQRDFGGDRSIIVPFIYETNASGIGEEAHHPFVWYNRQLDIPLEAAGKRILLHFQAVEKCGFLQRCDGDSIGIFRRENAVRIVYDRRNQNRNFLQSKYGGSNR
ncbi:sugar-binding domain-containing protein [Paenibacillus allorhizosphaerae]|uniref:Glycoside hydrolase family 2 n=1 Tax=Paenibacillus allorhizosphaerae TaxID=2849866 RepID=A0ABM8VPA1_9BACL|nr:sugar-binding domain-containing protein [Paenibacillus allorhizosphaerae]CAG7652565.1 hypothetical protein PAECIP111802_05259 [Paenibacillus allorhizosphaerae]